MDLAKLKQSIKKNEGLKLKLYKCPNGKLTIGYGRNLEDNGITLSEAEKMLETDLLNIKLELEDNIKFFHTLDSIRKNVLIEMAYQMGVPKLLNFKNTLKFMEKRDFINASVEMLDSQWHEQLKQYDMKDGKKSNELLRSEYLSIVMREGVYTWNL